MSGNKKKTSLLESESERIQVGEESVGLTSRSSSNCQSYFVWFCKREEKQSQFESWSSAIFGPVDFSVISLLRPREQQEQTDSHNQSPVTIHKDARLSIYCLLFPVFLFCLCCVVRAFLSFPSTCCCRVCWCGSLKNTGSMSGFPLASSHQLGPSHDGLPFPLLHAYMSHLVCLW